MTIRNTKKIHTPAPCDMSKVSGSFGGMLRGAPSHFSQTPPRVNVVLPSGHAMQVVEPTAVVYLPNSQAVHTLVPVPAA